jgi:hypothetical protein
MNLLFNGRLAPITSTIGFLEASLPSAVEAFTGWQKSIYEPQGTSVTARPIPGGLEKALSELLPLTSVLRLRHLFVPTGSSWLAYFDNGHRGTDAMSAMSFLAERLQCRGMRVTLIPDTIEGEFKAAKGEYGATVLEVYGARQTDFLNYVRSIAVVNDGGKWVFSQGGTPFPFEDLKQYKSRNVRQRFTAEHLERYLSELGLSPFDETFYLPTAADAAMLVEKKGLAPPGLQEYTLAELAQ